MLQQFGQFLHVSYLQIIIKFVWLVLLVQVLLTKESSLAWLSVSGELSFVRKVIPLK